MLVDAEAGDRLRHAAGSAAVVPLHRRAGGRARGVRALPDGMPDESVALYPTLIAENAARVRGFLATRRSSRSGPPPTTWAVAARRGARRRRTCLCGAAVDDRGVRAGRALDPVGRCGRSAPARRSRECIVTDGVRVPGTACTRVRRGAGAPSGCALAPGERREAAISLDGARWPLSDADDHAGLRPTSRSASTSFSSEPRAAARGARVVPLTGDASDRRTSACCRANEPSQVLAVHTGTIDFERCPSSTSRASSARCRCRCRGFSATTMRSASWRCRISATSRCRRIWGRFSAEHAALYRQRSRSSPRCSGAASA